MGDGRAKGLLPIGDRGQAAIILMSDIDGTYVRIFDVRNLKVSI